MDELIGWKKIEANWWSNPTKQRKIDVAEFNFSLIPAWIWMKWGWNEMKPNNQLANNFLD